MEVSPAPKQTAKIQELVCSGVAPAACAAWNKIATELTKPTTTEIAPIATVGKYEEKKVLIRLINP